MLTLVSTDGFVPGATIYVGHLSREGIEKASVTSVTNETTLTLGSALKLAHEDLEPVAAVLGDRIKIYRAANVDGSAPAAASFSLLATRTIDPDQPSTYYRDADGSSSYWYCYSYFDATSQAETDRSEPLRGQDFEHYASLTDIRKQAGFENARNLADSRVEEARRQAQSIINSSLSQRFTTPFNPVPEKVRTLTIQLAAALLRKMSGLGDADGMKGLYAQLEALASGDDSLTGDDGIDLDTSAGVSGYFGTEERMFGIGQRF